MRDKILKAIISLGKVLFVFIGGPILGIIILIVWSMDWSRDDQFMWEFEQSLTVFLDGTEERVTLSDLYGGTKFVGDVICINYISDDGWGGARAGVWLDAHYRLKKMFPDMQEQIAKVRLIQKEPHVIVAIRRADDLFVMSGNDIIHTAGEREFGRLRVEKISTAEEERNRHIQRKNGSRCVDFKQGVFKRDTYISKSSSGDTLWLSAVLTDSESPTQDEMEAAQQLKRDQKAKAVELATPQPDTSPQ
jgi:hypothetical protein